MAKQHRRYYFLVANHYYPEFRLIFGKGFFYADNDLLGPNVRAHYIYGDSWNFGFHLAVKGGKGAVAAVNPNAVLARKRALAKFYGI